MGNELNELNMFWAKKREDDGRFFWLPLPQHLEDTQNIAGLLWEHWLSEGQRQIVDNALSAEYKGQGKGLAEFLAAAHDLGKCIPSFQLMPAYMASADLDNFLKEKLAKAGFLGINHESFRLDGRVRHDLAGQVLAENYGIDRRLAAIIGAHHGEPVNSENRKYLASYKKHFYYDANSESLISKKWESAQKKIVCRALQEAGFDEVENLPRLETEAAEVLISGLLIMADWIASNEEYYPLIPIESETVLDKDSRKKAGFEKWLKTRLWESSESDFRKMYRRFGFNEARGIQLKLAEVIDESYRPGIFILEAPMGSGKTEAALVAVEQLVSKGNHNGIFFGLPTQATSNSMFSRISSWHANLCADSPTPLSFPKLVHGKAHLNDEFVGVAQSINCDDERVSGALVNQWFSGRKKSVLDDFVVGTVDQLLMMSLRQRHIALRHLGFSKKVVVIDEVHAYDAYMSQYLFMTLIWLGAYKVPVVILSATLPADRRIELVKSYMMGTKQGRNSLENIELQDFAITAYPLITYTDGDEIRQITKFDNAPDSEVEVNVKFLHDDALTECVEQMIVGGGIVGIIVNTVRRAQSLAKSLEKEFSGKYGDDIVEVFHSAFIATQRIKKENDLMVAIGRGALRPHRKIIIGTQVIEQSLDIDFDVMISDLAPMDLLIQRLGRLHRHNIERPQKHKNPIVYVLGQNDNFDFNSGSSAVYGEYLLARTQYYLPKTMRFPADISILVQKVYGDEAPELSAELEKKYRDFKKKHDARIRLKSEKASDYRIDSPQTNNLVGSMKMLASFENPLPEDSEKYACAQVRDIDDTIEVIALKTIGEGYGIFGTDDDISTEISDPAIAKEIAKNTLVLPRVFSISSKILTGTLKSLEKSTRMLLGWEESSWLNEEVAVIFDKNNRACINGTLVEYSEKYGLSVICKEEDSCVERK